MLGNTVVNTMKKVVRHLKMGLATVWNGKIK